MAIPEMVVLENGNTQRQVEELGIPGDNLWD